MGYQALLFCPDEKTARTVTQVLSELEFNVEACIEPFAAVKKLMGQHFDAVVVDCDNEQNATLLFKSARNSSSNQTSLAVAVVEGQAGVAKAFRIGANLVLTKPINIEQAKGTLRVARGLLRKAEPAKPGVPAATPAAPVAAVPAKPAPAPLKPISAVKPAAPAAPIAAPKRLETPVVKPPVAPAWPAVPAASASSSEKEDDDLLDIGVEEPKAPAASAPVASSIAKDIPAPVSTSVPATPVAAKPAFGLGISGAAAPAPARTPEHVVTEKPQEHAAQSLPEKQAEIAAEPAGIVGSAPSFSFGGASEEPASEGGKKKILIGIAAVVVLAAAYFGYSQFKGHSSAPATTSAAAPASATPPISKPSAQPAPVSTSPAPNTTAQVNQTPVSSAKETTPSETPDITLSSAPTTSKTTKAPVTAAPKEVAEEESEPAPLVVKGGKVPAHQQKSAAAPDVAAPSMAGMTPGTTPTPNFVPSTNTGFKPVLQTLNISQGVSQGLLIKKVSPTYPAAAQRMRIEGVVELMATVSKEGAITHIKVLSGDGQLTKAATDAVKQWKYKPYLLNGEPVEIQTQITVNFKLPR